MKQTNRKADLPLLLLAVVLIFLIVCPVGMIFAKAVMQNGRLGNTHYQQSASLHLGKDGDNSRLE